MPHALPADWQDLLDRVRGRLDETAAAIAEREQRLTNPPAAPVESVRIGATPRMSERLEPLDRAAEQVETLVAEVEGALRSITRRSESFRLKLADGTGGPQSGRAIG